MDPDRAAPALHRRDQGWIGRFPGLGAIVVDADGGVSVALDEVPEGAAVEEEQRRQALRHGWGELLAQARLDRQFALGAALAPSPDRGLLVCGDAHDVAAIVLALARRGWSLLSDRPTPVSWREDVLLAHPRPAPLVLARQRAIAAGVDYREVRTDSNAVAVDLPRSDQPTPVAALLLVERRRPNQDAFVELTGHRRFERAASVLLSGVLAPDRGADDGSLHAEHLRLAALPSAVTRIDRDEDARVDDILRWWSR